MVATQWASCSSGVWIEPNLRDVALDLSVRCIKLCRVTTHVGEVVGLAVGTLVVGDLVGDFVTGPFVVGEREGVLVVGEVVGLLVVGEPVGRLVGSRVGNGV